MKSIARINVERLRRAIRGDYLWSAFNRWAASIAVAAACYLPASVWAVLPTADEVNGGGANPLILAAVFVAVMLFFWAPARAVVRENKSLLAEIHKEQQAHAATKAQYEALQHRLEDRNQEVARLIEQIKRAHQ